MIAAAAAGSHPHIARAWRVLVRARQVVVALLAGSFYGSWAALVHLHHAAAVALRAGVTQAGLSITTTILLVTVLERIFRRQADPVRGFWLASMGTSTLAVAGLWTGHALAGTPHIAAAIAPSVLVGTTLYFLYARGLLAAARRYLSAANAESESATTAAGRYLSAASVESASTTAGQYRSAANAESSAANAESESATAAAGVRVTGEE